MFKPIIFSKGIKKIPLLPIFLQDDWHEEVVLGWGYRPTTKKARQYASQHNLAYIALEDGFLRSIDLGINGEAPLSIVYDDLGIYYDVAKPSRLEMLILKSDYNQQTAKMAQDAMALITKHQLSKYNFAADYAQTNDVSNKSIVLLIDQTYQDMAIQYGMADDETFSKMYQAALTENPDSDIWIKTHPDVISGAKKGYLTALANHQRIRILAEDINPISLLKIVSKVYVVTSQLGFEALLLDKQVITFGVPWYAGWGLTDDRHSFVTQLIENNRRQPKSILQLFIAAYLQYARYINPYSKERGNIIDVIEYLIQEKRRNNILRGKVYCIGLTLWKRAILTPYLQTPSSQLQFIRKPTKLMNNNALTSSDKVLVWGKRFPDLQLWAEKQSLAIIRVEDGFIRSAGLGSNLLAPISLVLDDIGLYFDAMTPSRLENILENISLNDEEIQQTETLIAAILENNISKYNVGTTVIDLASPSDKVVILITAQVETDASIVYGSPVVKTNLALLQMARANNPDAYIVYKPHPDMESGNREGKIDKDVLSQYADAIWEHADISSCINAVDEVHCMTSLAGFEALLRNKKVVCYGQPFYAGWGLTLDLYPNSRRTKKLNLTELVAGTLIKYPFYHNTITGKVSDVFGALQIIKQQRRGDDLGYSNSFIIKQLNKFKFLIRAFIKP